MKKVFLFLWCAAISFVTVQAQQFSCGTAVTPSDIAFTKSLILTQGCQDTTDGIDLEENLTLKLILRYAKNSGLSVTDRQALEVGIDQVFSTINMQFNYSWVELDCDGCESQYNAWPLKPEYEDCIIGDVLTTSVFVNSPFSGLAGINSGVFWAKSSYETIAHEIGHAIGLYHTFHREGVAETSIAEHTLERVTRNNMTCACNCTDTGDYICDTPPDPFVEKLEDASWNDVMYSACALENDDERKDDCNVAYVDGQNILHKNIMSYVSRPQCDNLEFTNGQNIMIRKSIRNTDGSYKYRYDPNDNLSSSETVNTSLVKNTDEAFDGDIIVNADLTIENCTIELTEGHKIIVNPGASLNIRNATIRTYSGNLCYYPMEGKTKWEGIEINPGIGNFTNVTVLTNSTLETSESGMYNSDGTSGLLNLTFNNSTLNGPAIDLSNTLGVQILLSSHFDHTVEVTNNFYLQVEGCTFDFPVDSEDAGIKAADTNLNVGKAPSGSKTTFINCGKGIDFISSSAQSISISNTDFDNVLSGIDASGVAGFLTVNDCHVKMRDPIGTIGFGLGLLIDNFMDYDVYNTTIEGSGQQKGIEILHTGVNDNPNLIINNEISSCGIGIASSPAELGNMMSGIEFNCNELINIQGYNFYTGRVGPHQGRGAVEGDDGTPAGNKFDGTPDSNCGAIPIENWEMWCNSDWDNTTGGFQFEQVYHFRDDELPSGVPTENMEWDNTDQNPLFAKDRLLKDLVPSCTYPIINTITVTTNPMQVVKGIRKNNLDGGGTVGTVDKVLDDSSIDPDGVLTDVLDDSPWVSVAVVQALFTQSIYYTEAEIANVIIQNPGVLDDPYINAIVFESTSFSSSNQQLMIQAAEAGDARIDYEQSLVDPILEGTLHIKDEMNTQVTNGIFDEGVIRNLIDYKISPTRIYQTVESFIKEGDYTSAMTTLDSRMGDPTFDPVLENEANVYKEILVMGASLQSNGEDWTKISNSDKIRLISIANSYNGVATIKARNILDIYHGMTFGAVPTKPAYSSLSFLSTLRSVKNSSPLTLYPNPTSGILHIDGADNALQYNIDIVSPEGRTVKSLKIEGSRTIDVSDLTNGVYIYTISDVNGVMTTDKFIILK